MQTAATALVQTEASAQIHNYSDNKSYDKASEFVIQCRLVKEQMSS